MRKTLLLFLFITYCFPQTAYSEPNPLLTVHFIYVGQGDAILIETPENETILIDGGEPRMGKRLVKYLKKQQVKRIDLRIATHPDFDHLGGLLEVLKHFPVKRVVENGQLHDTRTYANFQLLIKYKNIPISIAEEGEFIPMKGKTKLHILHAKHPEAENTNQSSIVLKLSYGEINFLLMGDVEEEQEELIAEKYDIESTILKVAHHGSSSSSSLKFLRQVEPEVSLISYHVANEFGHPVDRVIQNLRQMGSQIFSTAGYGNIVVETDGENYIVIPEKQPMERLIQ